MKYDHLVIFGVRGRCGNGGSRKRDIPGSSGHRLERRILFRDSWRLGGGRMTDYVTSGSDMRNLVTRVEGKVWDSLYHLLLEIFGNSGDVGEILLEA